MEHVRHANILFVYLMSCTTKSPKLYILAYCRQLKTGGGKILGARLATCMLTLYRQSYCY